MPTSGSDEHISAIGEGSKGAEGAEGDHGGGVRDLPIDEALELMGTQPVGRFAYLEDGGEIMVMPVDYAVDGTTVVFRTGAPATLQRVRQRAAVSFQVDDFAREARTGWSVLVRGRLAQVADAGRDVLTARPDTWPSTPGPFRVRIEAHQITARRLDPHTGEGALWIR